MMSPKRCPVDEMSFSSPHRQFPISFYAMNHRPLPPSASLILFFLVTSLTLRGEERSVSWRSLFNGNDLTGWTVVGNAVWRVEDGVIVGTQDGDASRSGLLNTADQFRDFEITLDFFLDEHGKYNSGVYLRNDPKAHGQT